MKKLLVVLALVLGAVGTANASVIYTDTYDAGNEYMKGSLFGTDDSVSWQFNILDEGYDPTSQEITHATVGLNLQDDRRWDFWEFASLTLGANTFSWEVDTGERNFVVDSLMVLSNTGLLDVTLTATFGDFYFNSATLTASAVSTSITKPVSVPEPASLVLMGLGLLGVAASTYRRKKV